MKTITLCNGCSLNMVRENSCFGTSVSSDVGRSSAAPVSSAGVRPGVRPGVLPDVRPDVRAARMSSAAPKNKSFDRGGPVWPPRSNVTNDRLGEGAGGLCPPSPKPGGLGKVNQKVYRRHLCYTSFNRVQNINAHILPYLFWTRLP